MGGKKCKVTQLHFFILFVDESFLMFITFEEIAMAFNIDKMLVCFEVINFKVECEM